MKRDWTTILTGIGTVIGVWALVTATMSSVESRLDARMNSLEERMFLLATGKTLKEAMLTEHSKEIS